MAKTSSSHMRLALGEEWVARALDAIDPGDAPQQVLARLDDRRVCLSVVAADDSEEAWSSFSAAAARRAATTGDRLRPLVASGRNDEWFYVAFEVGDAQPLFPHGELRELSSAQCVQLLHGVGRGLDQAAAADLYPSALTPDSVFVDSSRGALLADLGVAREALGNPPGEKDHQAPWVAPEVLRGEEAVERSAVYSFGALLYTLLTGAAPHRGNPDRIVGADPPSIRARRPDLPEALEVVVSTAMAPDPRRRYRTASEARSLANILLQGDLVPASPPQRRAPPRAPKPRRDSVQAVAPPKPRRTSPEPDAASKRGSAEPTPATVAANAAAVAVAQTAAKAKTAARSAAQTVAQSASQTAAQARAALEAKRHGRSEALRAPRVRAPLAQAGSRLSALPRLPLALAAGALATGALAGVLLAGPGAEEPPAPKSFARSGLQVRLPGDWKGSAPAAGALAAHPVEDPGSGLSLELVDAPVEREEQGNPVRLGRLEAWREPGAEVAGARAAVRYVVPTESGKLVATCRASPRATAGTLSTCERVASTLQLRSATGLPIAAVVEQQNRWQDEVTRLGKERATARRSLARAARPAGQRLAALALVRVHDRAAARFAALPGGEAVAAAARRTAAAYRALAWVADGESSSGWNAASARVRRSETSLRRALADS